MRKSVIFLFIVMLTAILNGCIISHSPKEDPVIMSPGEAKTFSIQTCIKPAKYAWYVDEVLIPEAMLNTYSYMLDEALPSEHTVKVVAGNDKYTWNVQYEGYKQTVFFDDTFITSNWDHTLYTYGNGGTQTYSQNLSGGNPDSFLYIVNIVNAGSSTYWSGILGFFIKTNATYDPSVSGSIAYIDYSEDAIQLAGPLLGDAQASQLVIKQGDNLYVQAPYFGTQYSAWTHLSRSGLKSDDFWLFDPVVPEFIPTSNPDFSSTGDMLTFGFCRANSEPIGAPGYTITGGIDNWQVIVYSK